MYSEGTDPVRRKLDQAEQRLEAALGEVCEDPPVGGVRKPDTGELIRIDETLALASEAAKQAIALRRQAKKNATKEPSEDKPRPAEQAR
jgi:hypothetical protein